ncbi:MAG: nucleotidyltransferase domain-containing protein [Deltaproteobacteria bacterium]|nr:nucleotidyltransferase domain-containing protein [Deltaproteobacteria bacterium]
MSLDIEKIKKEILQRLLPLRLENIILFGSYAYGHPDQHSDIDLYIVTSDDFIPKNYEEKNSIYMQVSRRIRDIKEDIPVDIVVHTKQMHQRFLELNSSFARKIIKYGVILYEANDGTRMA